MAATTEVAFDLYDLIKKCTTNSYSFF